MPAEPAPTEAAADGLFLICAPGLEGVLAEEARALGFEVTGTVPGGVSARGDWREAWRANRTLRCATRVLMRTAQFRALHLAQLDKRSRKLPWGDWLRADVPVQVEATCRKSRIYHAGAAAERVSRAIHETLGAPEGDGVGVRVRIEDDLCTISLDTTGAALHKRGLKTRVNKAPMRETLAAGFLRACGYDGGETLLDPMCGSGTFVIEAAEIAAGLTPGRARDFALSRMAFGDPPPPPRAAHATGPVRFYGSDRDQGAVAMARANAGDAGVGALTRFEMRAISDISPPEGAPGLVIANPPYGGRIGRKGPLYGLYGAFGAVLRERFAGWRVGFVTSDAGLARATGLDASPGPVIDHGGTKVRLWQARL